MNPTKVIFVIDLAFSSERMPEDTFKQFHNILDNIMKKNIKVEMFFFEATVNCNACKIFELREDDDEEYNNYKSGSCLYDAINYGIDLAEDKYTTIVIVVSNNSDSGSSLNFETLKEKINNFKQKGNNFIIVLPDSDTLFEDIANKCIYFPKNNLKILSNYLKSGYFGNTLDTIIEKEIE